jgi:hypothetical protein
LLFAICFLSFNSSSAEAAEPASEPEAVVPVSEPAAEPVSEPAADYTVPDSLSDL